MSEFDNVSKKSNSLKETNDCALIATAIATDVPYEQVHEMYKKAGRRKGSGVTEMKMKMVLDALGFKVTVTRPKQKIPRTRRGTGEKYFHEKNYTWKSILKHTVKNRIYILQSRNHAAAVKNNVVEDYSVGKRRVNSLWEIEKRK